MADVAEEAGVSSGLVSMVLSGRPGPSPKTAEKVIQVAQRMGYRPDRAASLLARRNTGQIGVTLTASNPYHGTLVDEILARAHDAGYDVVLSPMSPRYDYRESLEALVNSRCEALILINPQMSARGIAELVDGIPAVCLGMPLQVSHVDVIRMNDDAAMELLVDHLYRLGHRRIAHVSGGDQPLGRERSSGFEAAMHRRGLKSVVLPGGETVEHGAAAIADIANDLPFTALVAFNDLSALGVMDELSRHGLRVPEDVSVTGCDDDELTSLRAIDLTTIDPEPLAQAKIAVDLALERITGSRSRKVTRIVEPRLVLRGSTAAPRPTRA